MRAYESFWLILFIIVAMGWILIIAMGWMEIFAGHVFAANILFFLACVSGLGNAIYRKV